MEVNFTDFKLETPYNRLWVRRRNGLLELCSHDNALQSVIDLEQPERLCLRNLECLLGILLFVPLPRRVLVLGTAAGSLIHWLRHYLDAKVVSVDIDGELVTRMLELGALPPADARLAYVEADARDFLAGTTEHFDLILADVFSGARTPPWMMHGDTAELLRRRLADAGGLAYNLLIPSEHDFRRFYTELRRVFERRTLCLPVTDFENTIAYALRDAPLVADLDTCRARALELGEKLGIDFMRILAAIYNTNPLNSGII
ncbi:MAG: hypothetical protein QNJ85_10600 [Gammaproteobacteria bacterium]|nr:hypothetical protein [Gammaproteobacteria bacterium]